MEPALWAAKTGLDAQQTQMTVTANNLANVNTNGFKKSRAVFNDLLYQNVTQVGGSTSDTTTALVDMITAQRAFQANAQMIQTENQISQTIIQIAQQ